MYFPNGDIRLSADIDSVYISIRHRNHIAVMTPQLIPIIDYTLVYDFRTNDSFRNATSFGQKQLSDGIYAMYAGDTEVLWFGNNGVSSIVPK